MSQSRISRRSALLGAVAVGTGLAATSAFAKKGSSTTPPGTTPPASTPPATTPPGNTAKPGTTPQQIEGLADHLTHEQAHAKTLNAKLLDEHHHHHVLQGKNIHVTPVDLSHVRDAKEVAQGQAVAYIDTELAGDETGLPPGKYHIVTAKVGREWHAYAVANGKIVVRLKRVGWKAKSAPSGKKGRPVAVERVEFQEKGWGWFSWWNWDNWGARLVNTNGSNLLSPAGSNFIGWGGFA